MKGDIALMLSLAMGELAKYSARHLKMASNPYIAVAVLLPLLWSCEMRSEIEVRGVGESTSYGTSELLLSVSRMVSNPTSPASYRQFSAEVMALKPKFNQATEQLAERYLVFLAQPVMLAVRSQSYREQFDALATTVWPIVLGVFPRELETPNAFAKRVCAGSLAVLCKHIVPEHWPQLWTTRAWARFAERAKDSYRGCQECSADPSFLRMLDRYQVRKQELEADWDKQAEMTRPYAWPIAGVNAQPWAVDAVFRMFADGRAVLNHQPVAKENWRAAFRKFRGKRLGLHISPRKSVKLLRRIVGVAAKAGLSTVMLQAREKLFPYEVRGYPLATKRTTKRASKKKKGHLQVNVRDQDTVQVLIRVLDQHMKTSGVTIPLTI